MSNCNYNKEEYKQVLRPLIFFDLFSFPPTAWELWQYLEKSISWLKIENILQELVVKKTLEQQEGFYFLKGRSEIVEVRHQHYNYSLKKLKKAKFFSRLFSLFPGVLMVAAANFIGRYNWRQASDIDFFIITKDNYLWRSRLFCAGIAKLLLSRPTKKQKRDKICLSFYISESALNLKPLELVGGDPYFQYWRQGLLPLYQKNNIWFKFLQANRNNYKTDKEVSADNQINILEKIAKKIQLIIMPKILKEASYQTSGVVINDKVLKFYLQERRDKFRKMFNQKKYEVFQNIN